MAALSIGIATTTVTSRAIRVPSNSFRPRICCVGWDPEGLLGPPQTGHIARREFRRRLERDAEAREEFERQVREEKERRHSLRQSRVIPDTPAELIEYFLDTEAQDIEYEIARLRRRLNPEFFSHLQFELGQLRFAVSKSQDMEDRLIELEALQKALLEGTEAYDKMQADLITAKESLTKILTSKDLKATLLEMVERNELNRSLLTLLDENIANAHKGNQAQNLLRWMGTCLSFFHVTHLLVSQSLLALNLLFWKRKDPEGLLGPPQTGHIARREFRRRLERDAEAREEFERQVREEKERRHSLRQSRVIPDTPAELIEYFLDTEAQDIEYEIARLRRRLNPEFFSHLQFELGQLRFAVSKSQDMEDRLIELEALQKALLEGTEAYDKMQADLITAKESLTKILTSKDLKATLLEMVERNELNRSLLTLLDENIANAHKGNQVETIGKLLAFQFQVEFMRELS
ncbi:hypothetical protein CJ030_MR4G021260 [Morella rubra]|uniref:Uncharacterized protein n=1 Tax=Morella rubra TaxID=262757 RepID=A0A6A1VVV1_9ROSI|nr:hypothetical protein CJ030_MR4G021260 [Morella rubra]